MTLNVIKGERMSGFHQDVANGRTTEFQGWVDKIQELFGGILVEPTVELSAPHSKPIKLVGKDNVFQIFLWGYVEEYKKLSAVPMTTLWGKSRFYKEGLYTPTGLGTPVMSPEGVVVAEYFPNERILNVLFDICHTQSSGTEDSSYVLAALLTDFINGYYEQPGGATLTKEEIAEKRRLAYAEVKKKNVIAMLSRMAVMKIEGLKTTMQQKDRDIAEYSKLVLLRHRERDIASIELAAFTTNEEAGKAKLQAEFEKIRTVAGIKDYDIEDNKIVFITDTIYAEANGRLYLMGDYKVTVDINDSRVKFYNQDEKNMRKSVWGEKCHHPHVSITGEGCLGNVADTLMTLIHQNEWAALADMLVGYLQAINLADSAGKHYRYWDEVDPKTLKVIEGSASEASVCPVCNEEIDLDDEDNEHCSCGNTVHDACSRYTADDGYVCRHCFEAHYFQCDKCDEHYHNDTRHTLDGNFYCENCHNEKLVEQEKAEVASATPKCPICGNECNPEALYTCESCGTQGCTTCIQVGSLNGNTAYLCPTHR